MDHGFGARGRHKREARGTTGTPKWSSAWSRRGVSKSGRRSTAARPSTSRAPGPNLYLFWKIFENLGKILKLFEKYWKILKHLERVRRGTQRHCSYNELGPGAADRRPGVGQFRVPQIAAPG